MNTQEVVAKLLKEGAIKFDDVFVKNVTVTPMENHVRLGIRLKDKNGNPLLVDTFSVDEESLEYKASKTDLVFVSLFAIGAIMRNDEELAAIVDHMIENPHSAKILLAGAKLTLVQQKVEKDAEYANPFSEKAVAALMPHDTIVTHVVDVKLTAKALATVSRIEDKMLGLI